MLESVARPKSPDGRRVPMSTRFSEPEAAAIDAARGNTGRSEWLREVALAAASASDRKPLPTDVITIVTDERMPPGTAAYVGPSGKVAAFNIGTGPKPPAAPVRFREPEPNLAPMDCKHPRVHGKGACPDCFEWVAGKP
jgi:hypothetical protein